MNVSVEHIRLGIFFAVLVICALWESNYPRKTRSQSKLVRWLNNLGLVSFNSFLLSVLMPFLAFSAAQWAQAHQFGLLYWLETPSTLALVISVVLLDAVIYWQHLLFHRIPLLWRLHRMHHADQDIDVTTGSRFHPLEILISAWIKIGAVTLLGVSPIAVVVFEVVLNASAMFNHSNAKLPYKADQWLRLLVVTPDMHRVHHSVLVHETHSNFGFFLSIWDRLFRTYIAQPEMGHERMKIGLPLFRQAREQWLDKMLTQPFRDK
ncbi:sterol desaturase [Vibrio metoecus]|uniref:sterol desaturase family protein n=1 Tax=Vibrio TaxID=662 RepID=UPI000BA907DC|nr:MULTISPECIES: sterol desaturase family protein [Vibrio]PAR39130.1 sterol desaturase [Vibrio metoecus]PAR45839.1 sterol desaturase [Vibrio metoecus]PAR52976.1 sterol desaturase [Vibrio metoecus]RBM49766.1 sterol desaturase family protein [Vibrio tarriae]